MTCIKDWKFHDDLCTTSNVNSHVIVSVIKVNWHVLLNLHIMINCLMCPFAGLKKYI